jgi:hypothetical protein
VITAIYIQRWLVQQDRRRIATSLLMLATVVMGSDLIQHLQMWSIPRLEMFFDQSYTTPIPVDLLGASAAVTAPDQFYVWAVNLSPLTAAASALFAAALILVFNRWWQRRASASSASEVQS